MFTTADVDTSGGSVTVVVVIIGSGPGLVVCNWVVCVVNHAAQYLSEIHLNEKKVDSPLLY